MDAASKIDMASVCYYTFSTVCQTLAGAFGFLVAVVLYRLQGVRSGIETLYERTLHGRHWEAPAEAAVATAFEERDYLKLADALARAVSVSNYDARTRDELIHNRNRLINAVREYRLLQADLPKTLALTGWVIFLSLLALFSSPYIAHWGIWTWVILIVDWLGAGACLRTYYDVAKEVVE